MIFYANTCLTFLSLSYMLYKFAAINMASFSAFTFFTLFALYFFFKGQLCKKTTYIGETTLWGFSFILSLMTLTGYYLDNALPFAAMSLTEFLMYLVCVMGVAPLFKCLLVNLYLYVEAFARKERNSAMAQRSGLRTWLYAFMVIFVCWLPVWLAFYPGLWNYDPWQVWQYLNNEYDKMHPLLHTLLMGVCYTSGFTTENANKGVMLYDFIQMSFMAGVFAYAYTYIAQHIRSHVFCLCTLLFFAIFPVNSIMAISSTKDVIFSGLILLCLVLSVQYLGPDSKREWRTVLFLMFCMVLMTLFRNNASYALVLTLILAFFMRKFQPMGKKIFLFILLCLLVFELSDWGLSTALSAQRGAPKHIKEALSVPSQQFGRIYNVIHDAETKKIIESFYNVEGLKFYNPHLADLMKSSLIGDKKSTTVPWKHAWDYVRTILFLAVKYPLVTLDSFLYTTEGSWYIHDISHSRVYGDLQGQAYLSFRVEPGFNIVHESKFPFLKSLLERAFSDNEYQNLPLIPVFFAPAFYIWILLFCTIGFWKTRQRNYLFMTEFFWFLLLTVLAGPCILVRYVYPFIVCAPMFCCMLIRSIQALHATR